LVGPGNPGDFGTLAGHGIPWESNILRGPFPDTINYVGPNPNPNNPPPNNGIIYHEGYPKRIYGIHRNGKSGWLIVGSLPPPTAPAHMFRFDGIKESEYHPEYEYYQRNQSFIQSAPRDSLQANDWFTMVYYGIFSPPQTSEVDRTFEVQGYMVVKLVQHNVKTLVLISSQQILWPMFVSQTNLGLVFGKGRIAYITRTLRDLLSHPIPVDPKRNVRRPIQLEVIGAPQQGVPQQGAPQQGAPQQGTPQQGVPHQGAPQQGVPHQGAPQQGAPQQGAPQQGAPQQGAPQQGHPEQVVSYQTSYQDTCQRPSQITSERASYQGPGAAYQVASQNLLQAHSPQQGAPAQTHFPSTYFPLVEPGQPANKIIKDYRDYLTQMKNFQTQPAQYQRESTQASRSQGGPSDANSKGFEELEAIVERQSRAIENLLQERESFLCQRDSSEHPTESTL
jgi:hypothetical protein